LSNDEYVLKFKKYFSDFSEAPYSLAVNNGSSAIEIALHAINIANKHVVLPTNTFIATATAIKRANGIVTPVDIEKEHLGLSPKMLINKIRLRKYWSHYCCSYWWAHSRKLLRSR
jgi:dTDP-4-amino-4,6-dideoxygalactose transaminase